MNQSFNPIVIGKSFSGEDIVWNWYSSNDSRISIVGDNNKSNRREIVTQLAQQFQSQEHTAVYWITAEESAPASYENTYTTNAIPSIEAFPDPSAEFEDSDIFIQNRKMFVSSYIELLCKKLGKSRKELFPRVSYRAHMEGPSVGYMNVIESMEDSQLSAELEAGLRRVEEMEWEQTEQYGQKYYVERQENIYDTALSFLSATWSLWANTMQLQDPQQVVMIVEPPKELLYNVEDEDVREITASALRAIRTLTDDLTATLILSSEAAYPTVEHHYRHRVMMQTENTDINVWDNEVKQRVNKPAIYHEWANGNIKAGLFEDAAGHSEIVEASFEPDDIRFSNETHNRKVEVN